MGTQGSAGDSPNALPDAHPDVSALQLGERLRDAAQGAWLDASGSRQALGGVVVDALEDRERAGGADLRFTLVKAARGLGISFETLLAQASAEPAASSGRRVGGRLMVTRKDDAVGFSTSMYEYRVHANGLRRKHMTPLIMAVKARSPGDVTSWSSHEGEEFIFVIQGLIELHTEFYEPARLEAG